MPPISSFMDAVEAVTGGIKMLTIREHRFHFCVRLEIGTDSTLTQVEHLLKNVAIFLI